LRDLFWLLTVVGLMCGWWMQQGRIAEARRDKAEAEKREKLSERIRANKQLEIDAWNRDGRLHAIRRPDGSVYITDKMPPPGGGFGPAGE
jgi:hypothetical protein